MFGNRAVLTLLFLLSGIPGAFAQQPNRVGEHISAIAKGADNAERRAAITRILEANRVEFSLEEFTASPTRTGTNVVAALGQSAPQTILLGAHYDRVAAGLGALDNGAGCAVLLRLVESFKTKPLEGYNLRFVFFDLEENGLLGSRAHFDAIRNQQTARPLYAINLDVFGYGDTIFATPSHPAGPLVEALQKAGKEMSVPVTKAAPSAYPSSDHRTMIAAGVETLGISLLDAIDVAKLTRAGPADDPTPPRVLTLIHTAQDTTDVIRAEEIEKALPLLERVLRALPAP
jgi:Zn-dependent M28 family amino/carboxypeptidase